MHELWFRLGTQRAGPLGRTQRQTTARRRKQDAAALPRLRRAGRQIDVARPAGCGQTQRSHHSLGRRREGPCLHFRCRGRRAEVRDVRQCPRLRGRPRRTPVRAAPGSARVRRPRGPSPISQGFRGVQRSPRPAQGHLRGPRPLSRPPKRRTRWTPAAQGTAPLGQGRRSNVPTARGRHPGYGAHTLAEHPYSPVEALHRRGPGVRPRP
jgi:hypothetical protein